jgi:hypothetical protein
MDNAFIIIKSGRLANYRTKERVNLRRPNPNLKQYLIFPRLPSLQNVDQILEEDFHNRLTSSLL